MQLEHGDRRPSQRLPVNPRRHKVAPEHRKRVATACNSCNVRRIKCSGDRPCSQCASTARDCVYPTIIEKVSVPRAELDDLRKKVEIYEKALQDVVTDPAKRQELLHNAASPDSSSSTSPFASTGQSSSGGTNAHTTGQFSGPNSIKTEPNDDENVLSPGRLLQDGDGTARYTGETSGATFLDHLKELMGSALPMSPQDRPSNIDSGSFLSSLGQSGTAEHRPMNNANVNPLWLPPDSTVSVVLSELRHFIQDGGGQWASGGLYWWGDLGSVPVRPPATSLPDADLNSYRHLSFYHAALAVACHSTTTQPPPSSDSYSSLSEPYYARAALLLGNTFDIKRRTIGDVASLALMSFYLLETNRPDASYMYISAAMHICIMLGAHRGWVDERGKRVFWSTYCLDRWLSCLMGRPPSITDDAIQLPMPADDPAMPPAAGMRAHIELSRISGHVVSNTYGGNKHEAGTRQPDNAIWMLEQWQSALPPPLQLVNGLSNDPAACLLHMRYNQLLIVAIRPLFLSAVKRAVADRLMAQAHSVDNNSHLEHLKCCIAAAGRNIRLARHLLTLNGHRKLLQAGLHFIFNAAVVTVLHPLVFKSQSDTIAAKDNIEFAIEMMLDGSKKGNLDGQRCAETLHELQLLVNRMLTPIGHDPMLTMGATSAAPPMNSGLVSQDFMPPPLPVADDPVLYDELVTWMGDDWPIYNSFVTETEAPSIRQNV